MNKGIGVIGAGARMCGILREVVSRDPGIRVAAVYDPDPQSVERARQVLPRDVAVCGSEAALLARDDVGWVFVGSPNVFHVGQIRAAFAAGKHVFCEKPLATTAEDCALAGQLAADHPDLLFFFGLVLRYSPFYRRVKEILDSGEIGKILSFEFNETLPYYHGGYIHGNWRRHRRMAGTHLLEKSCHDIDLANWFTGSVPVRAAGFGGLDFFTAANRHIEEQSGRNEDGTPAYRKWADPHGISPFNDDKDIVDNQVVVLEYGNGARAVFHTNCHAGIPERRFYLCGTRGALRADALTSVIETGAALPGAEIRRENAGCPGGHAGSDGAMAEHLIRSVKFGVAPSAGMREAVDSTRAALLVDRATDEGRVVRAGEWGRLAVI